MKKNILIVGIILVLVVAVFIIIGFGNKRSMLSISRDEIKSVVITNGNNGNMVELSPEEITALYTLCSPIECKKINREPSQGWGYSMDIVCENSSIKITFVSNGICIINHSDYEIEKADGEAIISLIETFY